MRCGFNYINSSFRLLRISLLDLYMQNEFRVKSRSHHVLPGVLKEVQISETRRLCGACDSVETKKVCGYSEGPKT